MVYRPTRARAVRALEDSAAIPQPEWGDTPYDEAPDEGRLVYVGVDIESYSDEEATAWCAQ